MLTLAPRCRQSLHQGAKVLKEEERLFLIFAELSCYWNTNRINKDIFPSEVVLAYDATLAALFAETS